jgi:hypothetical protein
MFGIWFSVAYSSIKRFRFVGLASGAAIFLSQTALAIDTLPPPPELKNPSAGANLTGFFTSKTPYEFWLTCLICIFGLAVIFALLFAMRRSPTARPEDIARPIIVVTVITGTLMLITVGYNNEQIAPAFGLFGTIVGYMLGRFAQPQQPAERPPQQQAAPDPGERP